MLALDLASLVATVALLVAGAAAVLGAGTFAVVYAYHLATARAYRRLGAEFGSWHDILRPFVGRRVHVRFESGVDAHGELVDLAADTATFRFGGARRLIVPGGPIVLVADIGEEDGLPWPNAATGEGARH